MNKRLAIFFRNFFVTGFCHVGLGVNAYQTEKVLRRHNVQVDVYGVPEPPDILTTLMGLKEPPTHVVIEAIWVDMPMLKRIVGRFPSTEFIVRTHSQVGFLQVEPPAVKILREMLVFQGEVSNFHVGANNRRLIHFLEHAYGAQCVFLPNLYDLEHTHSHYREQGTLRIASFGALRLLKNHMTAAAAAMLVARHEQVANLEFWMTVNRAENAGAQGILTAVHNLFADLPWARLVEHPWSDWAQFRKTMNRMDLYFQPSFTETFNITVADAIAEGVPAVVSDAIDWAPDGWKAEADNAEEIARVGVAHLHNPNASLMGLNALRQHVTTGVRIWLKYLDSRRTSWERL